MEANALFKDQDGRVSELQAEARRQAEAYGQLQQDYGEEHVMRRMVEQQYASRKKKVGS